MNESLQTDARRQELSAFMDGELNRERALFMIKALCDQPVLAVQWQRLHLLRHYLREGGLSVQQGDFLAALHRRLEQSTDNDDDAAEVSSAALAPDRPRSHWSRRLASAGIAAGVAAMALFSFNKFIEQRAPGEAPQAVQVASTPAANAAPASAAADFAVRETGLQRQFTPRAIPVHYDADQARMRRQLNNYLLRHSQLSSGTGRVGFVSYTPLLSGDIVFSTETGEMTTATSATPEPAPVSGHESPQ